MPSINVYLSADLDARMRAAGINAGNVARAAIEAALLPTGTGRGRLVELTANRRMACLADLGRPEHFRYLAHTEPDGTIIMRPVDVVPAVVGQAPARLAPAVDREIREAERVEEHADRVDRLRDAYTRIEVDDAAALTREAARRFLDGDHQP